MKNRTIFCRDNIDVLKNINTESIDLVYLDPPFNKKRTFHAPIGSSAEGASFKDTWHDEDIKQGYLTLIADLYPKLHRYLMGVEKIESQSHRNYLIYMAQRLIEIKRILKKSGSVYLHCDDTMSHYLKLLMDCIFGHQNFRNEIVWSYQRWTNSVKAYTRCHDTLFFYSKNKETMAWNAPQEDFSVKSQHQGQRVSQTQDGKIVSQEYVSEKREKAMRDVWNISILNSQSKERVGYPTQKPLALLERIIAASSQEGEMVLDPFCGCATTCVAAEKLGRQWIGIDVSKKAYDLVKIRLDKEVSDESDLFKHQNKVIYRTDVPQRTDVVEVANKIQAKHLLYEQQEGICSGCKVHFEYRHFEVDHLVPKSKGGGEHIENLQLLCSHCNRIKSDGTMEQLFSRLKEFGILK